MVGSTKSLSLKDLFHEGATGIITDPTKGPDSGLYEAMGYARNRERKRGRTRNEINTTTAQSVTQRPNR